MSRIRKASSVQVESLNRGTLLLKAALTLAKDADCPSLCRKIRSAIKSAGGAGRHMRHRMSRMEDSS